jgi:hypothetical protein
MRRLVPVMAIAAIVVLLVSCAGGGLALYFLVRSRGETAAWTAGTQKVQAADGSEIAYPSGYEALDVRDPGSLMRRAEQLQEPARSMLGALSDQAVFAAIRDDRLLLVTGRDALLEEVPESERAAWRAEQEALYRQVFAFISDTLRSSTPDAQVVLDGMTWSERKSALGVLELRFSYFQGRRTQPAWMAFVFFPQRIYTVLSVGDEKGLRLLLESSRFAPERGEAARAPRKPTATQRAVPTPTPTRMPTPTAVTPFAFPPGWRVLTREEILLLFPLESVPPEVRPYAEIVRQGAQAVAYDPKSPRSLIVVARQDEGMTREQADLIRRNWKSVSEALVEPMRAFMENAGWTDVRVEPPELFDHRPSRGRAALLAIRFQGSGEHEGARHEFRSAILRFEDVAWVVTAINADWKTLELVLENSRW